MILLPKTAALFNPSKASPPPVSYTHLPASMMTAKLQGLSRPKLFHRVFLTGANPFVLKTEKLLEIAALIRKYLPSVESIGCFARITDSKKKTDEELILLRQAGYNRLTIGVETGDRCV